MHNKQWAMMALGGLFAMSVQAQPTTFQPDKHTTVTLALHGQQVNLEIQRNGHTQSRELRVQAEKPLHIELDDFNFDGAGDFAIWHVDDGMGTYTIHRVFIYNPTQGQFVERFPACGDEFLNLKVNKPGKFLVSTYYQGNIPRRCLTRPDQAPGPEPLSADQS